MGGAEQCSAPDVIQKMIIDNLLVNALKKEFLAKLINGRIEKIYQPDQDSFLLQIWNNKNHYKLLICLNPNSYRICITTKNYDFPPGKMPKQYSPLCLQLKKNIESGYIAGIEQLNFDRILVFKIESFDNVKDRVNYLLIIELTGKYSNLLLTEENYDVSAGKIIACFKQIDQSQNEQRQILVGHPYHPITNKANKTDLAELNREQFNKLIFEFPNLTVSKFLINNYLGISSHTADLIIRSGSGKDDKLPNKQVGELNGNDLDNLFSALIQFSEKIKTDSIFLKFTRKETLDFTLTDEQKVSDISPIIDDYFFEQANINTFNLAERELKKIIGKNKIKTLDNINKQEDNLETSKDSEIYKQYGDLLLANIHLLTKKADSVTLKNFYDDDKPINITLDENLTISENAQKFFKIYSKAKNARIVSTQRLSEFKQELEYLEQVDISISLAENPEDLREIETELEKEKYLTKKIIKGQTRRSSPTVPDKNNLLTHRSSEGLEILIGKNNSQNDFLTTKLAQPDDIWLHTRLIPGSHVVIRTENGQKYVSEKTILEAAHFAAKYSKAKYSGNVCVIYTKIKHVKKPPRSKPGYVIYSNEKAVYVTP